MLIGQLEQLRLWTLTKNASLYFLKEIPFFGIHNVIGISKFTSFIHMLELLISIFWFCKSCRLPRVYLDDYSCIRGNN